MCFSYIEDARIQSLLKRVGEMQVCGVDDKRLPEIRLDSRPDILLLEVMIEITDRKHAGGKAGGHGHEGVP